MHANILQHATPASPVLPLATLCFEGVGPRRTPYRMTMVVDNAYFFLDNFLVHEALVVLEASQAVHSERFLVPLFSFCVFSWKKVSTDS